MSTGIPIGQPRSEKMSSTPRRNFPNALDLAGGPEVRSQHAHGANPLSFPGVTEEEPFGPEVVVYKVMGRMFALVDYDSVPPTMNLKCDPDRALDLRDVHEAIRPGWHMNKRHWNTLDLDLWKRISPIISKR